MTVMNKQKIKIAIVLMSLLGIALSSQGQPKPRSGYVAVNGLKYYYQIQGEGEPLLLLHGGFGKLGQDGGAKEIRLGLNPSPDPCRGWSNNCLKVYRD